MASSPLPVETTLEIRPRARLDVIDVRRRLLDLRGDEVARYPKSLYVSYHTTAGYPDQSLCARLDHSPDRLQRFLRAFRRLFPPDADYHHDQLHLRSELSEEQRLVEPRNADSHLTFIGAGLHGCVTYDQKPETPAWFVDLDGINGSERRRRRTTVVAYHRDEVVASRELRVPVSSHGIDSINLTSRRLGFFEEIEELVSRYGVTKGRVDLRLLPEERYAGLTVNEYETLLMQHDLAEVLGDPLRYMAEKGRDMLRDPRAIPSKTMNYAKYDVVQVLNEVMDLLGLSESLVERIVNRILAVPASRFLRMKRTISLPVIDRDTPGRGAIVRGTYQSPILVQWRKAEGRARRLAVRVVRFR